VNLFSDEAYPKDITTYYYISAVLNLFSQRIPFIGPNLTMILFYEFHEEYDKNEHKFTLITNQVS